MVSLTICLFCFCDKTRRKKNTTLYYSVFFFFVFHSLVNYLLCKFICVFFSLFFGFRFLLFCCVTSILVMPGNLSSFCSAFPFTNEIKMMMMMLMMMITLPFICFLFSLQLKIQNTLKKLQLNLSSCFRTVRDDCQTSTELSSAPLHSTLLPLLRSARNGKRCCSRLDLR